MTAALLLALLTADPSGNTQVQVCGPAGPGLPACAAVVDGGLSVTVANPGAGVQPTQDADAGATLAQVSAQLAQISTQLSTIASRLQPALNGSLRTTTTQTLLPPNAAQETGGNLAAATALQTSILANQTNGAGTVQVTTAPPIVVRLNQSPLNPLLPRCNAVRTTQCQP
jgi:hypothetical protein